MSEEFRNGKTAGRKYFVANRGSDSEDDSDDDRPAINEYNAYHYPPAYHQKPTPNERHDHHRPTLRTDLGPGFGQYSIQRQPLSSPSSASSQSQVADESTPVPLTTPGSRGLPIPSPPNVAAKSMQSLHDALPINDRHPQDIHHPRNGVSPSVRPSPNWANGNGPRSVSDFTSARRPRTSPATSTPDSAVSTSFTHADTIRICVTAEGAPDSMSLIDVSGMRDGSSIRQCILSKTYPNNGGQHTHSIYRTLVGDSTFGDPLSDDQLLDVVKTEGDERGSLRFFVVQFEIDKQPPVPAPRPEATGPPAVLPLRPKRRSRSRQNSVSSNASEQPFELGYDADRDDDDSRKSCARQANQSHLSGTSGSPPSPGGRRRQPTGPLPPHPTAPPPMPPNPLPHPPSQLQHQAYPQVHPQSQTQPQSHYIQHILHHSQSQYTYPHPSSPISQAQSSKPPTPPTYFDRSHPSSSRSTFLDRNGQVVQAPGPPPPLSPRRGEFSPEESNYSIPPMNHVMSHGRSNSDAGAEREQLLIASEQQYEPHPQRHPRTQGLSSRSRGDSPRDSVFSARSRKQDYEWSSANGSDSTLNTSDHGWTSSSRLASSRAHRSQLFGTPKAPLATPSMSAAIAETRPSTQRVYGASRLIHLEKGLRSKPPDSHGLKPRSSSEAKSLVKGKSMDNLRQNLPISKSSGRSPLPQLPTRPSNVRDGPYLPSPPYGIPSKPSEPTRPAARALPLHSQFNPQSPDTNRYRNYMKGSPQLGPSLVNNVTSPNRDLHSRDPISRPRSAADNHSASPTHQRPHCSPSFGSNPLTIDHSRSAVPVSPNRPFGIGGPRPLPHHSNSNCSDRSSDVPSGPETNSSTPPRTPISPVSSKPSPPGNMPFVVEPSSPTSDSNNATFIPSYRTLDSDLTIRDDDKTQIQAMLKNMNAMLSQQHLASLDSNAVTTVNDLSDDDDYGDGGTWVSHGDGGTWIVAPKRPPSTRPELSKLRTDLPSDTETTPKDERQTTASQGQYRHPQSNGSLPSQQRMASNPAPSQNRVSGFADGTDDWEPRPEPEDVLERLDEFFPEHDLDKLVIEANSGGNSPVTVEPLAPLPAVQPAPNPVQAPQTRRHKKSIRIVAEEQKKRIHSRVSRTDSMYANNAMLRKRNTKLWDSKLEEVDTMHVKTSSIPESPSSSSPSAPTFKWVRGELIGKGTYGRVYLALNATTGEMIAVKQVELPQTPSDRNDSRQTTVVQALKLESETLKDLDHPHIVQYLGFEETPANLSIFLEYVPGGSVGSWLHKHGRFSENMTKSFTSQILDGLQYLHSKGIIHRDLKADNILVEMNGTCKISDFGISKRTDEIHGGAFTALQGTVFWMAPEVINTQGKGYNFKIDIWSVGCVVLEMWGGRRPWTGQEMVAVMFKLYEAKLPPPVPDDVRLSPLADDLRQKCFAINPDERPCAAELKRHPYLELPPNWVFPGFGRKA